MTKRFLATAGAAALLLAAAGTAQAQDWSGFYVGVQGGYTAQDQDSNETVEFDTNLDGQFGDTVNTTTPANAFSPGFCDGEARDNNAAAGCRSDDDASFSGGVRGGWDWQSGSLVLGVVAEADFTDIEDNVTAFSITPAAYTLTRNIDSVVAIRARAGIAMGPYLGYVTGGFARGDVESSFATTNVVNTFVLRDEDDEADGYQLGLGVERRVADSNWVIGAEYLYTNLDDGSFRVRSQGPAPGNNPFILVNPNGTDFRRSNDEIELSSFRLTVAYRF